MAWARRGLGLMAALVAMACPAGAARAQGVTLDDINRLAAVSDPVFAPDGRRLAYTLTINDAVRDAQYSDIWAVDWDGAAKPLTSTPDASEWRPEYSDDGKWIAFLSDAGAGPEGAQKAETEENEADTQLWLMRSDGGTPRRVSSIPGGISDFNLSPDGRSAVVVAEVGRAVGSKARTPPPIVIDRFHFKADGRGYLDDRTQQLFVIDLETGSTRQITVGRRDHWHPEWSPDGKWIAYTAKDQGEADRTLDSNVFIIAPTGGEPRRISPSANADNDPDWGARPAWSPDSRRLVWLEGEEDKWIYYGPFQLAVADIVTGEISRPGRIDRWFYNPRWSEDGRSILTLIEQDRAMWLARVEPETGAITYLTQGKRFAYDFAVGKGGRLAVLDGDTRSTNDLRRVGSGDALTNHNPWVAERRLADVRELSFRSGDVEIHGLLTLPPGHASGRLPLIVNIHGGPVYQFSHEFDLETQLYAAAGYAVLQINPRGSSGRGFDFARAIYADWGNLDARDISAGIDHVIAAGIADPDRIGVGGWSYGGILSNYMIASDERIKAAVSGAGVANVLATYGVDMYAREYELELGTPWDNFETWKKLAYPFLNPKRITAATMFQCTGEDLNVPCAGSEQMYLALRSVGIPTTLIVYPGQTHSITVPSYLVDRMRRNIAWYDRWLKYGGEEPKAPDR